MPVINLTRAARVGNEPGISGAEAPTVEGVITLDQVISAGVEEAAAMSGFKDRLMQNIALLSDQDVSAQFLGVRYPILQLNVVGPDTITYTGDLTNMIFDGDIVRIEGSAADDGLYLVEAVAFGAGVTTITIALGNDWPTGGGGAVGTFARVCTFSVLGYRYDIATATSATGVLTVLLDLSDKFAAGDFIAIMDSTGNNGIYELLTVTTDGPPVTTTTLTVVGAALDDNVDDGDFYKVRPAIELTANEPYLWSIASGIQNPFIHPTQSIDHDGEAGLFFADRGDVIHCLVNNAGATNANFDGRIGTDADLT